MNGCCFSTYTALWFTFVLTVQNSYNAHMQHFKTSFQHVIVEVTSCDHWLKSYPLHLQTSFVIALACSDKRVRRHIYGLWLSTKFLRFRAGPPRLYERNLGTPLHFLSSVYASFLPLTAPKLSRKAHLRALAAVNTHATYSRFRSPEACLELVEAP